MINARYMIQCWLITCSQQITLERKTCEVAICDFKSKLNIDLTCDFTPSALFLRGVIKSHWATIVAVILRHTFRLYCNILLWITGWTHLNCRIGDGQRRRGRRRPLPLSLRTARWRRLRMRWWWSLVDLNSRWEISSSKPPCKWYGGLKLTVFW